MRYDFDTRNFVEEDLFPDKIAVAASDIDIDWKTLKLAVEKLANQFKKLQIPKGHPVVIFGHKEGFFAEAILSCIHAEVTYIPVDKIYPLERIRNIIVQTGSQILINCSSDVVLDVEVAIIISSNKIQQIKTPDYSNEIYGNETDPLQYIMFTSGSTGNPKGVQITQSAVRTYLDWVSNDFGFTQKDVFLNQALFSFDVSLGDLLNAFSVGGTLVLTSTDVAKNAVVFLQRVKKYNCTVWSSTPSFVYLFLHHPDFKEENYPALHSFILAGEELPKQTCISLKEKFPNAKIINAYGPTEATIITTKIEITKDIIQQHESMPIGYAMPSAELWIEKENPSDRVGELIICGNHVSVGYLKNEELTTEIFFLHNGNRAYKTGDLVYEEKGIFFYVGRNDEQVKFNGFRIELNEITNVISQYREVKNAVTLALKKNNTTKKIISFVALTSKETEELLKTEIYAYLKSKLPYYMIPSDILFVNEFPYNANHKIDSEKLINFYLQNN